jgi:Protein of unknown function (DUF433)
MRISVELILGLLARGESEADILADYPDLEAADIRACIAYAHAVIARHSLDAVQVTKRNFSRIGVPVTVSRRDCANNANDVVESRGRCTPCALTDG